MKKKATRCSGRKMLAGSRQGNNAARITSANAMERTASQDGMSGRRENALTKLSKYSVSGATHSSGAEAMSVLMWPVTASRRAEGTALYANQPARRRQVGRATAVDGTVGLLLAELPHTLAPHPMIQAARAAKPSVHADACPRVPTRGSITNTNASRTATLPRLLAAYRK